MTNPHELTVVESCSGCGACCQSLPAPPYKVLVTPDGRVQPSPRGVPADVERLLAAPAVAREIRQKRLDSGQNHGPCCWLDPATRACQWYEYRPEVCRAFEMGCDDCLAVRKYLLPELLEENA